MVAALGETVMLPEHAGYRLKRRLLGPPLTSDQLENEKLSNTLALGVLSSDCISSSAYGSEEMLLVLLPVFGALAYTILLPMTAVVLGVLLLVTLSYRQVVMVYTRAGGSYVVARENFGTTVAQVGAVALMLDYIVTVAVQSAAGTAAVTSAVPALAPWTLEITVGVVVVLFYGNLRGIREAGRAFAFPTYFFVGSMLVVIFAGIVRQLLGDLPHYSLNVPGAVPSGSGSMLLSVGVAYVLLKSFANGGSSLTGLEAISNGVSAFREPAGRNARRTLVVMSSLLATLVAGVSWLAHETHAVPYESGTPTVISQVARAVLGDSALGHIGFLLVQLATMLILWTGANTPFNGFPFLVNFVATDQYLPRWLTKRGHRLAFSNGIVALAVVSVALLLGTGAHVDKLVAFYAIGVFTGFTLAGFGMATHYRRHGGPGAGWKVAVNTASGALSAVVVLVFAITKFTEGAWLVVVIFPVMVFGLIRLNRQYRREAAALAAVPSTGRLTTAGRHVVLVLVDNVDLAAIRAIRYARTLKASSVKVVHFVIDSAHAEALERAWERQPGLDVDLNLVDCPDRRLGRAALELVLRASTAGCQVTVLLPRRTYSPLLGRLLHDRTADEIAQAVSQVKGVAATILPFDVRVPLRRRAAKEALESRSVEDASLPPVRVESRSEGGQAREVSGHRVEWPSLDAVSANGVGDGPPPPAAGTTPIGAVAHRHRAVIQGKVRSVRLAPIAGSPSVTAEVWDATGGMTLVFYGRRGIAGLAPGATVRATGLVGDHEGALAIANPAYELIADEAPVGS